MCTQAASVCAESTSMYARLRPVHRGCVRVQQGCVGEWRGCVSLSRAKETIALFHTLLEGPQLEWGLGEDREGVISGRPQKSCLRVGKLGFLAGPCQKIKPQRAYMRQGT